MALARASHQEEELAQLSVFTDALPSPCVCALHNDIVVTDTIVVHVSLPWVANSSKSSLECHSALRDWARGRPPQLLGIGPPV